MTTTTAAVVVTSIVGMETPTLNVWDKFVCNGFGSIPSGTHLDGDGDMQRVGDANEGILETLFSQHQMCACALVAENPR